MVHIVLDEFRVPPIWETSNWVWVLHPNDFTGLSADLFTRAAAVKADLLHLGPRNSGVSTKWSTKWSKMVQICRSSWRWYKPPNKSIWQFGLSMMYHDVTSSQLANLLENIWSAQETSLQSSTAAADWISAGNTFRTPSSKVKTKRSVAQTCQETSQPILTDWSLSKNSVHSIQKSKSMEIFCDSSFLSAQPFSTMKYGALIFFAFRGPFYSLRFDDWETSATVKRPACSTGLLVERRTTPTWTALRSSNSSRVPVWSIPPIYQRYTICSLLT